LAAKSDLQVEASTAGNADAAQCTPMAIIASVRKSEIARVPRKDKDVRDPYED